MPGLASSSFPIVMGLRGGEREQDTYHFGRRCQAASSPPSPFRAYGETVAHVPRRSPPVANFVKTPSSVLTGIFHQTYRYSYLSQFSGQN